MGADAENVTGDVERADAVRVEAYVVLRRLMRESLAEREELDTWTMRYAAASHMLAHAILAERGLTER